MRRLLLAVFCLCAFGIVRPCAGVATPTGKPLQIYFIDVEGGQSTLVVSPSGESLLIDTGNPGGRDTDRIMEVVHTAGVTQIDYLIITHYHGDHIANSNDFAGSTWVVQKPERDAMFAEDSPVKEQLPLFNRLKDSKTKILDGQDFDVFGDGTVVVKGAYGHTPGHQVIFVKLAKSGPILLSGDLYHYREERFTDKTPTFEFNGPQSLASRANIEAFLKKSGAQLWIEHDLQLFRGLKKAPEYYE